MQKDYSVNLESSHRYMQSIPLNLVDKVWEERPPIPPDNITPLPDRVIRESILCIYILSSTGLSVSALYLFADKYLKTGQKAINHSANTAINSSFVFYGWLTDQILT